MARTHFLPIWPFHVHEIKRQDVVYEVYVFPVCHRRLLLNPRSAVGLPPSFPQGWATFFLLRQWPIIEPFCMYTVSHCSGRIPCFPHTFLPTFGMWKHWPCIWWPGRKVALSEVFPLKSPREAGNRREEKREGREGSGRGCREKKENDDKRNGNHSTWSVPQYGT